MCITSIIFILLYQTAAHFWHFCIKAVHNLKKSLVIILIPKAMFVPISAFLFLVSEVACGE